MDIVVQDPNLSVVVPGGCNAHCDFCFWKEIDSLPISQFNKRLRKTVDLLPDLFYQVSVTGGEPTLCSGIKSILKILRKRFEKVVFTTNGVALEPDMVKGLVDHVNISRHHWDDDINVGVYQARGIPTANDLKSLCDEMNQVGIDVTLHCVLTEFVTNKKHVLQFIDFAKACGASGISFRKQHSVKSTNAPSAVEKLFLKYKEIYFTECPVCRSKTQLINGMPVNWKSSSLEPSKGLDGIYELIMHPDGVLTSDWEAQQNVELHNDEDDVILSIRMMGKTQKPQKSQKKRADEQRVEQQVSPLSDELTSAARARMLREAEEEAAEIRRPRRGTVSSDNSSCGYSTRSC
jgi:MoaA/NifB/PqqE/SkfB family radical SAM enzyme